MRTRISAPISTSLPVNKPRSAASARWSFSTSLFQARSNPRSDEIARPCATGAEKHYATLEHVFVDMEPEDQLCLMLARRELSREVRVHALQLLASPLRWPLFLEHARKYDICPIIYQSLETLGFRCVPHPIRTDLAKIFGVNAIRCEVLGRQTAFVGGAMLSPPGRTGGRRY